AGISERTHFPGPEYEVGSILRAADFFVYSSLGDTFGMAVTEAMLAGVPLLVNDLPILKEVTGGNEYVHFFRTKMPETLTAMLIECIRKPEAVKQMSAKAQQFAESKYL